MPSLAIIFFGIFSAICALVFEFLLLGIFPSFLSIEDSFSSKTFFFFLLFAFIEECSKYIFLRQYEKYFASKQILTSINCILLAIYFGTGFFLLEYFLSAPSFNIYMETLPQIFLPTLLFHITTSFCFLFFFSRFHSSENPFVYRYSVFIIGGMTLIHLAYNSVLFFL